jgi:DNA-directed RNA polymerase I, II, and III subunit RPABC2
MTFKQFHYDSDDEMESFHDDDDQSTSSSSSSSSSSSGGSYGEEDVNVEVEEDNQLGKHIEDDSEEKYDYDEEGGDEMFGGADGDEEDDKSLATSSSSSGSDDDDEEDEKVLQKIDAEMNKQYLVDYHPESVMHNEEEVAQLCRVVRDAKNNIIDELHRTLPYLTKYEKARILGQRAKQINAGAKAFVEVPEKVIDGYLIAELELKSKRIPFILRRPLPNGGCEYWHLRDLEVIDF